MIQAVHKGFTAKNLIDRLLQAKAYASVISQFVEDKWLDNKEVAKLRHLFACLSKLGWAPGE